MKNGSMTEVSRNQFASFIRDYESREGFRTFPERFSDFDKMTYLVGDTPIAWATYDGELGTHYFVDFNWEG